MGKNSFLSLVKGLQRVPDHRWGGMLSGTVTFTVGQRPRERNPAPGVEAEQRGTYCTAPWSPTDFHSKDPMVLLNKKNPVSVAVHPNAAVTAVCSVSSYRGSICWNTINQHSDIYFTAVDVKGVSPLHSLTFTPLYVPGFRGVSSEQSQGTEQWNRTTRFSTELTGWSLSDWLGPPSSNCFSDFCKGKYFCTNIQHQTFPILLP